MFNDAFVGDENCFVISTINIKNIYIIELIQDNLW